MEKEIDFCMGLIGGCFERIQTLDIKPTVTNTESVLQTLYDLRDAYNKLKEVKALGRDAVDIQGRDND